jgi:DNA polymerase IV (DinB-like DNA polymerase)
MQNIIALLDLDYFYAQCEMLRNPSLRGKPVVIVMPSMREGSGAIATCNYEARALKIRSGQPLSLAKKLANSETIFINADKQYYEEVSKKVFDIVDFFSEKVEQVSIDEAYFDLTNPIGFEKAKDVCEKLKEQIRSTTGLTCSIGVSYNKLLAKMAASYKKPDGLFIIEENDGINFLNKQKISALFGVGPKAEEIFEKNGVKIISDVLKFSVSDLISWFGEAKGKQLFDFAHGIDSREIVSNREKQQLSRLMTLKNDVSNFEEGKPHIDFLSDLVFKEATKLNKSFKTVSIIIVTPKYETITRSVTLEEKISSSDQLKSQSYALLKLYLNESFLPIRRLGVRVSNFGEDATFQKKLFDYK